MTPTVAITEYEPIAAALATVEKYRGLVCDVTTPKGMAEAKAAQREVGALRIALEKTRKKVKEDVVARGKLIDGEANRIFALIAAIEVPLMTQIDAEEDRVERERQAAIEAEQKRLADEEAARKRAEEEALATQRAELARQAAALKAEQDRLQEEDRARRRALAAEEDAARRRIQAEEERSRAIRQAEEDHLARERRAIEDVARVQRETVEAREREARRKQEEVAAAEQAAREARLKEQRDAAEAEAREQQRKENELLDARHMLEVWFEKYGHLQQFKTVAGAIGVFLTKPKAKRAA